MKIITVIFVTLFQFGFSSVSFSKSINNTGANILIVAGSDTATEAELVRLSKVWMDAMLNHDSAGLVKLMSPDYTLGGWGPEGFQKIHRTIWLHNLFNNLKILRWEQTEIAAQVYGDVGIVTSVYNWAGSMSTRTFDTKGYLTDVWVRKNNKWQVVSRVSGRFPEPKKEEGK